MSNRFVRWLPAALAPVLVAGVAIAAPLSAGAAVTLPPKTAQQVLELVENSTVSAVSGTVTQTSDLGLPELPTTGVGSDSTTAAALELLTGNHTARVYLSGKSDRLVQILDSMGERDVVQHGTSVWAWDSAKNTATHLTLPASSTSGKKHPLTSGSDAVGKEGSTTALTPAEAAELFLSKIDASTAVTVDSAALVAGRTTYSLVLTPKTSATLVGSVRIAVDSATGLPLQVSVLARGQAAPAVQVGFTTVNFSAPAAKLFLFTPPKGATVKQIATTQKTTYNGSYTTLKGTTTAKSGWTGYAPLSKPAKLPDGAKPKVSGTGWASVVEIPAADVPKTLTSDPTFNRLTQAVDGGRVASTSLLNVFIASDGRVFAGAVPVSTLESAAR